MNAKCTIIIIRNRRDREKMCMHFDNIGRKQGDFILPEIVRLLVFVPLPIRNRQPIRL